MRFARVNKPRGCPHQCLKLVSGARCAKECRRNDSTVFWIRASGRADKGGCGKDVSGELFVVGCDAPPVFDAAEVIFDKQ
jgi:hypothetical protein